MDFLYSYIVLAEIYVLLGLSTAFVILLYLSVLVHELSHSVVARGYGLPVRRILLYPLGGISEIEREAPTPGREFAVAGAGPALSLVLGAVGFTILVEPVGVYEARGVIRGICTDRA